MNEPRSAAGAPNWKHTLVAVLPVFVALPAGYVLSALLVHGALVLRGLEPWKMDASSILSAFGPLELSLGGVGNQLAFLALALPALLRADRRRPILGSRSTVSTCILSAAGMYSLSVFLSVAVSSLGLEGHGTLGQINDVLAGMGLSERLALLPVLAISAGLSEELFFRGFLFRRLEAVGSDRVTVMVSALAFGLAHLDFVHSTAAFVMGIFLGWLRLRTGSVWPGVVAHIFSNGAVVLTHAWLDDLGDVPAFGLLATALVFGLVRWALQRRIPADLSEGYTPRPTSSADPD